MRKPLILLWFLFFLALNKPGFAQVKTDRTLTRQQISALIDTLGSALKQYYIFPDKGIASAG